MANCRNYRVALSAGLRVAVPPESTSGFHVMKILRAIECTIVFDVATLGLFDCIAGALGTKREITQSAAAREKTLELSLDRKNGRMNIID